jgi:hypothetical protein
METEVIKKLWEVEEKKALPTKLKCLQTFVWMSLMLELLPLNGLST